MYIHVDLYVLNKLVYIQLDLYTVVYKYVVSEEFKLCTSTPVCV